FDRGTSTTNYYKREPQLGRGFNIDSIDDLEITLTESPHKSLVPKYNVYKYYYTL
ncbi:FK506-binding protein 4, partial [Trichinella spiralis]|uniref:FK506-binding protein 4 n=1 Tax=Trichinella spiralis TaxID=6334 RepID=UPI0001EFE09B